MLEADEATQAEFYEEEYLHRWGTNRVYSQPCATGMPLEVALVGSGAVRQVALVGCGKRKAPTEAGLPAHQLYIGNPFRMAYRYATDTADDVHILSALHGLVHPYQTLAPYDMVITQMTMTEQREWGQNVVRSLKGAYPLTAIHITFYAGGLYVQPIVEALQPELGYWTYEDPLHGMDLFERLRFFKSVR